MLVRMIPRLDIKGPNLVKGIHLEGLRVLGKPETFARLYYENGADELLYMDAVASLYGRNSLTEIIQKTAQSIFIPLTVGGGLRSIDDIRAVLHAGADKVAINTAAIANPDLIAEASRRFGSSTIVISIEAIRQPDGSYIAFTDCGRENTGVDAIEWARKAVELGAGEVLVTSVNQEGTGEGFDLELTRAITQSVSVPVIACGGAGKIDHLDEIIRHGEVNGVAIASMLHYGILQYMGDHQEDLYADEGNTEFLRKKISFTKIAPCSISALKTELAARGIGCRIEPTIDAEHAASQNSATGEGALEATER